MSWASTPRNDDLYDFIIQEFNTKYIYVLNYTGCPKNMGIQRLIRFVLHIFNGQNKVTPARV